MTRVWMSSRLLAPAAAIFTAAIVLGGCAWIQKMQAVDREKMLAAAGFQMKIADTPERLEQLKAIPQRKLVPHNRDGEVYYVYADALACRCIYVGTEQAYQRYRKLEIEKEIADEQRMAAAMNEQAAMDWNMWGPWGPWY